VTTTIYAPGTEEKDPKKIIMSLQAIGAYLTKGYFAFPATQVNSTDPNTLDDYEEGTWTPGLTFSTPGNLSIAYSLRNAYYTKIGRLVGVSFAMITSTFTHTTASGAGLISGLPFTPNTADAQYSSYSPMFFQGINKASYTVVHAGALGNTADMQIFASGMGQPTANVLAADMPTGGTVVLAGNALYVV